jgi:16S rRNA processing protein RimM
METLTRADRVYLGQNADQPVAVESIRLHKGNPLLKLEGINDMDSAQAMKGVEICLPPEKLSPLEEGEYFLHDLIGLTVMDHLGKRVGTVEGIVETGGPPVITVAGSDGRRFMVPFASGTIEDVDLGKGTIRLINLPGLVDENMV